MIMGLFKKSKKSKEYEAADQKDYDEDYYEEDPWYSHNIEEDKRKKKKKKEDDSLWDGMGGEFG